MVEGRAFARPSTIPVQVGRGRTTRKSAEAGGGSRSAEGAALCRGAGCPRHPLVSRWGRTTRKNAEAGGGTRSPEGAALCRGAGCPRHPLFPGGGAGQLAQALEKDHSSKEAQKHHL